MSPGGASASHCHQMPPAARVAPVQCFGGPKRPGAPRSFRARADGWTREVCPCSPGAFNRRPRRMVDFAGRSRHLATALPVAKPRACIEAGERGGLQGPAAEGATAPETLRPPDRLDPERWKAGRAMPVRTEGVIRASRGEISQVTRQRGRVGFVTFDEAWSSVPVGADSGSSVTDEGCSSESDGSVLAFFARHHTLPEAGYTPCVDLRSGEAGFGVRIGSSVHCARG